MIGYWRGSMRIILKGYSRGTYYSIVQSNKTIFFASLFSQSLDPRPNSGLRCEGQSPPCGVLLTKPPPELTISGCWQRFCFRFHGALPDTVPSLA